MKELPINKIICGDCIEVMKTFPENSIDTIITDPPYGLEFMGKEWDKLGASVEETRNSAGGTEDRPGVGNAFSRGRIRYGKSAKSMQDWHFNWAKEALRVAKPGATLLCFGGTRTFHRLACAIEDAGWIIKDCIMWIYGSGFPKSHNVSLGIDKLKGHPDRGHRIAVASRHHPDGTFEPNGELLPPYEAKAPEAKQWEGYGSALKPAYEPIIMAMKPNEGSYAENALKWGVAGLNIDGGKIGIDKELAKNWTNRKAPAGFHGDKTGIYGKGQMSGETIKEYATTGRFPANLILDEESAEILDEQSGERPAGAFPPKRGSSAFFGLGDAENRNEFVGQIKDKGGASRFFKVIKPYYYQDKEYQVEGFIKKCKPKAPSNYNDKGRTSRYFKVIK